jgi:hypothetical protein
MITITCDAPGCSRSAVVPLLNLDGRLRLPDGEWMVGSSTVRTVIGCSTAHFNAALVGQQPLRASEPAP